MPNQIHIRFDTRYTVWISCRANVAPKSNLIPLGSAHEWSGVWTYPRRKSRDQLSTFMVQKSSENFTLRPAPQPRKKAKMKINVWAAICGRSSKIARRYSRHVWASSTYNNNATKHLTYISFEFYYIMSFLPVWLNCWKTNIKWILGLTLLSILSRCVSWEALTAFIMVSLSTKSCEQENKSKTSNERP